MQLTPKLGRLRAIALVLNNAKGIDQGHPCRADKQMRAFATVSLTAALFISSKAVWPAPGKPIVPADKEKIAYANYQILGFSNARGRYQQYDLTYFVITENPRMGILLFATGTQVDVVDMIASGVMESCNRWPASKVHEVATGSPALASSAQIMQAMAKKEADEKGEEMPESIAETTRFLQLLEQLSSRGGLDSPYYTCTFKT